MSFRKWNRNLSLRTFLTYVQFRYISIYPSRQANIQTNTCFNIYSVPEFKEGCSQWSLNDLIHQLSCRLFPLTTSVDYHSLTLDLWSKLLILSVISADGGCVCVQTSRILPPFLSVCDRDLKHFTSVLLLSGASANVPHYLPSLFLMHCGRAMDGRSRRKREGAENEGGENRCVI